MPRFGSERRQGDSSESITDENEKRTASSSPSETAQKEDVHVHQNSVISTNGSAVAAVPHRQVLREEDPDAYSKLGFSFSPRKKWSILSVIFYVQVSMNVSTLTTINNAS